MCSTSSPACLFFVMIPYKIFDFTSMLSVFQQCFNCKYNYKGLSESFVFAEIIISISILNLDRQTEINIWILDDFLPAYLLDMRHKLRHVSCCSCHTPDISHQSCHFTCFVCLFQDIHFINCVCNLVVMTI